MKRSEQSRLERIWKWYVRRRSPVVREFLLLHYRPQLKEHALRLRATLPAAVEIDDLTSTGMFGLMKAIDAFDPGRGTRFETFCSLFIRGAMLDELRKVDEVSRVVRKREKLLTRAVEQLRAETGRPPTNRELADRVGMSEKDLASIVRARPPMRVSLSVEPDAGQREPRLQIRDPRSPDPSRVLDRQAVKEWAVQGLSREERLIVILYYYEEMTMKEIGAAIGLCESRVSQLLKAILARLRERLADQSTDILCAG